MTTVQTAPARTSAARKVVSKGGIEAWLVEDHANPLVAMRFSFEGGGAQDPRELQGLAYMASGLLDEGAGPYDSAAFHERLDDLAVEMNFDVDRDYLSGSLKTLTQNRDEAFELLRLALQEPRLDEEANTRVRAQILSGLRRQEQEPNAVARNAFAAAAYPGHPYGMRLHGSLESVPNITREALLPYLRNVLARDTLKVAVVGDIDEATLATSLDAIFGGSPAKARLAPVADAEMAPGGRQVIVLPVPQSVIVFALPGLARNDKDFAAGRVMNHILGGGSFTSRLWTQVRETRGLAYSVHSSLSPSRHGALLAGSTSTKNERAAESITVISEEIEKLAGGDVSPDELDKAKKYLIGSYPLRFDTSTGIAREMLQAQLDGFGLDFFDRRNAEIAAVGPGDIVRVAKRLLDVSKMLVVVVGQPTGL